MGSFADDPAWQIDVDTPSDIFAGLLFEKFELSDPGTFGALVAAVILVAGVDATSIPSTADGCTDIEESVDVPFRELYHSDDVVLGCIVSTMRCAVDYVGGDPNAVSRLPSRKMLYGPTESCTQL